jgi:hypothetical protein
MRIRVMLATVAAVCALTQAFAHRPAASRGGPRPRHGILVRGALHVHTGASEDARGSLDAVAGAARRAGLDFIAIADHNTDASLGCDGYRRGVLVLGGIEKSTDAGHAVVLGLRGLPFRLDGDPATVARDAADLGAFVVAAHPSSSHPEARWSAGFDGVAGVEVVNFAEPGAWPQGLGLALPLLRYTFDPDGALLANLRVSRVPFARWDRALDERPLAGLVGSDAHGGARVGRLWLPFPSHERIFRLASQYLLLAEPLNGALEHDRALVLAALRAGRGWVGIDGLAAAHGFSFTAEAGSARAGMGESLAWTGAAVLRADADAPDGSALVLLRDGREVARGPAIRHAAGGAGTYRVEAYLPPALVPGGRPLPWIVSNPIFLYPQHELQARAERAARVPPELEARADVVLPITTPSAEWHVDRSPDSFARVVSEGDGLRFDYRLGAARQTHAAVCDWRKRDLSGYRALVFRVRADSPVRFDVQVRTAEGARAQRIWRLSIRADTSWRRVALPLAALKTYDQRGGSPDLQRTIGLYFHLDEAMRAPGSSGTLWIDSLGLGR